MKKLKPLKICVFLFVTLNLNASELMETQPIERALRRINKIDDTEMLSAVKSASIDSTGGIEGLEKTLTKEYIKKYSNKAGLKWIESVLKDGEPYLAYIREEIELRGMPPEILYLPVIESGFKTTAKSASGAAGLWQFMLNSIRPYMKIDEWVDERLDFWKSTQAALSKLEQNHKDFGDWALALAAYNSGSGAISRVIKKAGIKDYWALCEKNELKAETAHYVPKLLAVYHIISNPRKYGLDILAPANEYRWVRLPLDKQINISLLAGFAGLDKNQLKKANSDLLLSVTPPSGYFLKVLQSDLNAVKEALEKSDIAPSAHKTGAFSSTDEWEGTWIVKKGDTLWAIARDHGIKPDILAQKNNMKPEDTLRPGKELKVP